MTRELEDVGITGSQPEAKISLKGIFQESVRRPVSPTAHHECRSPIGNAG